jgi:hypothetical protein
MVLEHKILVLDWFWTQLLVTPLIDASRTSVQLGVKKNRRSSPWFLARFFAREFLYPCSNGSAWFFPPRDFSRCENVFGWYCNCVILFARANVASWKLSAWNWVLREVRPGWRYPGTLSARRVSLDFFFSGLEQVLNFGWLEPRGAF